MNVQFVKKSGDSKTGPMSVSYQESSTCPDACPHKGTGCYARFHRVGMHWNRLDAGLVGCSWDEMMFHVEHIQDNEEWRYGIAGDLPGKGNRINKTKARQLVKANGRSNGFGYTHKPTTKANVDIIREMNEGGFCVNLSADTLKEADKKADLKIGPVVVTIPEDPEMWPEATEKGRRIVPCPAVTHKGTTCATCKLCAKVDRKVIIGFPAHGTGKRMVEKVYFK